MPLVVLDGGLGTELERRGFDVSSSLWSAKALVENPQIIYDVHYDYLKAGSEIIISSTYQASSKGFIEGKIADSEKSANVLIKKSVELAINARDDFARSTTADSRKVAASIGPYGAILGNGAEYSGDYLGIAASELKEFHQPRLAIIAEAKPDILALETIPNFEEVKVLVELADALKIPFWVSLSLKDAETLADGTPLKQVVSYVIEHSTKGQLLALGANCFPISIALQVVSGFCSLSSVPIIVYPNSGESYDPVTKSWGKAPDHDTLFANVCKWYANGAKYIGGCCRTTPEDIRLLSGVSKTL